MTTTPGGRHWLAAGMLLLACAGQGVGFVVGKASLLAQAPLVAGESSWFVAAQNLAPRFIVGVVLLVACYGVRVLQLTRQEWKQAAFLAGTSFVGCLFQVDGMQRTSASVAAFITQFYVMLIPCWTALLQRRRSAFAGPTADKPGWVIVVAVALVLTGMAVLAGIDWRTLRIGSGELAVMTGAVFFSFMLFSINWPGFAANRPERATAGMFALEAVAFALLCPLLQQSPGSTLAPLRSPEWVVLIIAAAVIASAGPFILVTRWQRFMSATEAGLIYSLGPVFSALTGLFLPALIAGATQVVYPNETLTAALVGGGVLIFAANALVQFKPATPAARS